MRTAQPALSSGTAADAARSLRSSCLHRPGCSQITELIDQLRGRCGERQVDGARIAIAENGGGFLGDGPAAAAVSILGR